MRTNVALFLLCLTLGVQAQHEILPGLRELEPWWEVDTKQEEVDGLPPAVANHCGMSFVLVPAGIFSMGSPEDEEGRWDNEPQHEVEVSRSVYMAKTEVTQSQYLTVMGANPSGFKGDDRPVESVSWLQALEFCNRLSELEMLEPAYAIDGRDVTFHGLQSPGYRLPSEAEWELACRAGADSSRYDALEAVAWHRENADLRTHDVAQKRPNAWGLYDMLGNVWEWCFDVYEDQPADAVNDPLRWDEHASHMGLRVVRGGGWNYTARACRAAKRAQSTYLQGSYIQGFRPVRTIP